MDDVDRKGAAADADDAALDGAGRSLPWLVQRRRDGIVAPEVGDGSIDCCGRDDAVDAADEPVDVGEAGVDGGGFVVRGFADVVVALTIRTAEA